MEMNQLLTYLKVGETFNHDSKITRDEGQLTYHLLKDDTVQEPL